MQQINNIGRRKTAVARVYMRPGNGNITVNKKDLKVYFPSDVLQIVVNQPLELVNEIGKHDFFVNVKGGGISGQAQAVRMGIARSLVEESPENRTVIKKDLKVYFPSDVLQIVVNQPLELVNEIGKHDFFVNVKGGGISGQAQAVRMGIARSLVEESPENRTVIKKEGYLTRDSRMVERKKFGRRKARRSFQFSKR